MKQTIQSAVKSVLAGTALSLASAGAHAEGAVTPVSWDNVLGAGETISALNQGGNRNSYTDNSALENSAWGHTGKWYNFQLTENATTTITASTTSGDFAPAFTVWASGENPFDGGTGLGLETNFGTASANTPHSFNVTGQLGSVGTMWMSDPSVPDSPEGLSGLSNMLETLGYANSGIAHTGEWGEDINYGANAVSGSGLFASAITGSVGTGFAELILSDLQSGWYTVFIGGACTACGAGQYDLNVSAVSTVPVPAAVYLFGTALTGLLAASRRKKAAV